MNQQTLQQLNLLFKHEIEKLDYHIIQLRSEVKEVGEVIAKNRRLKGTIYRVKESMILANKSIKSLQKVSLLCDQKQVYGQFRFYVKSLMYKYSKTIPVKSSNGGGGESLRLLLRDLECNEFYEECIFLNQYITKRYNSGGCCV